METSLRDVAFTIVRFSGFAANALVLGTLAIVVLVLRPTFAALDAGRWAAGRERLAERLEGLVHSALMGAAAAAVIALVLQAALTAELEGGEVGSDSFLSVLEAGYGPWYAVRLPLVAGLLVLLTGKVRQWSLASRATGEPVAGAAWWWGWGVLGVALLSTSSFSGHASVATPRALSLGSDVVHLVAGATWFSGIVVLSVVLPDAWLGEDERARLQVLSPVVRRFSHVAMIAIGIVLVTGVIASLLHVGELGHLASTPYGLSLTAKLLLFGVILALGGFNHFVIRKRFEHALEHSEGAGGAAAVFRKSIAVELVVGLALMGVTGWLTGQSRTRREDMAPPSVSVTQRDG